MTEEEVIKVTKFIGDIVFNNGEKDINVSDLATVDEVNEALKQCVKNNNIYKVEDVFTTIESSPTSPLIQKDSFVYDDSHVMSSLAVKMLLDKLEKRIAALEQS